MSKPKKKVTKVFLILLIVAALLGLCFFSVAMYAKHEFEKDKSWLPPKPFAQQASVTDLPDNTHDAYEYVMRLYDKALHSDSAEGSWHTDVDLSGEITMPFQGADATLIRMIRDGAVGSVQALYPTVNNVKMSDEKAEDLPVIGLKEDQILEYAYNADNVYNRKGEYKSDVYEIVFKVDPAFENTDEIRHGKVYEGICDILKDAMTVNAVELTVKAVEIRFSIDRLTDHMKSVTVSRSYDVAADVTLTEEYAALLPEGGRNAKITLPYKATEHVNFMWYGIHFTVDYMEQKPDDIVAIPIDVYVNPAAVQGEDFNVTYEISDPDTLSIDKDFVLTVKKTNDVSDTEGIHVKAILTYDGKEYPSNELIIYITKLDKTTTGVRFWEDSCSLSVGTTQLLPAEIRVPINEQADNKAEEEYELFIKVSDEDALTVEVDGKELYATAKKVTEQPVTVTITMKCGGHTYTAEIPVTITEGTEVVNNGR